LASTSFAQTVRRVNPDPTVTGTNVYNTLQAAHNAASNGDILIVEPGNGLAGTAADVGNLNCIKTLTIYGRGYYLDKNPDYVSLLNTTYASSVGTITVGANNCKLIGLNFRGPLNISGGVSGLTVTRNNFAVGGGVGTNITGGSGAPINNIVITQNNLSFIQITGNQTGIVSNVSISNNFFSTSVNTNQYTSNIVVNQNTIGGINGNYNCLFTNNIFINPNQSITALNTINTSYNYNVFTGTFSIASGVGANNTVVANLSSQFSSNTGGSDDNRYRVQDGSPLLTASSTGGQVGMFGGSTPYVQYGIPAMPAVTKFFNTGLGNATTPITATVSAKSNN
jgi:hypothetical protein